MISQSDFEDICRVETVDLSQITTTGKTQNPTTTKTGLKIRAGLDTGKYPTGIIVTDEELAALNLKRANFHGEWNYKLMPLRKK